jgi:hypothetical protein
VAAKQPAILASQRRLGNAVVARALAGQGAVVRRWDWPWAPPPPAVTATFTGVPDRLVPRGAVPVNATVAFGGPGAAAGVPERDSVARVRWFAGGSATIDGGQAIALHSNADRTFALAGGDVQTAQGKRGSHVLRATSGGRTIGESTPFTIAAWPERWRILGSTRVVKRDEIGRRWYGLVVEWTVGSDSGVHDDLDEVETTEVVGTRTYGSFADVKSRHSSWLPLVGAARMMDSHTIVVAGEERESGWLIARQLHRFHDRRTGRFEAVPRSGYLITQTLEAQTQETDRALELRTEKTGANVRVDEWESRAGAGEADETFFIRGRIRRGARAVAGRPPARPAEPREEKRDVAPSGSLPVEREPDQGLGLGLGR